jgi:hypothetical protein
MRRRLRVYLDDKDLERLDGWTRQQGCTRSQTIRIDGLPADLSANFKRYLDLTLSR